MNHKVKHFFLEKNANFQDFVEKVKKVKFSRLILGTSKWSYEKNFGNQICSPKFKLSFELGLVKKKMKIEHSKLKNVTNMKNAFLATFFNFQGLYTQN